MQEIDWGLYQGNLFYRDLVNSMIEHKRETECLRQQYIAAKELLRAEQARSDAEAANRHQRILGYANQLPYRQMTQVCPMQWSAPYPAYRDNFVNYWSESAMQSGISERQQEELRRAFHSAVDCAAELTKEKAPVPSIIFDGLGVLTAGSLLELAKSVASLIDTASGL